MKRLLYSTALCLAVASPALASQVNIAVTSNNGFDAGIPTSAQIGTGTVVDNGNGTITVNLNLDPTGHIFDLFFHGPNSSGHPTIGFDLGLDVNNTAVVGADVQLLAATFNDTNPVTSTPGLLLINPGQMDGTGSWQFGIDCNAFCQSNNTHVESVSFTLGDALQGGLDLASLVPNSKDNLLGLDVWSDTGGSVVTGFASVNPVVVSTVPEPATWSMMLLGLAGVGYAAYRRNGKSRLESAIA
jgi:hypothetical protein